MVRSTFMCLSTIKAIYHTRLTTLVLKIKDRRTTKRKTIQKVSLKPIRSYSNSQIVNSQSKQNIVFMFNQFALSDKQVLLIEINEKNGVRNQVLKIGKSNILRS